MPQISEFRRSSSDSLIAGVCGGIARHWGVDPTLVRVATAVLALSAGIGIIGYAAAWLLVARDDHELPLAQEKSAWARRQSDTTLWIIAAVVGFVFFLLAGSMFPFGVGPLIVLLLVWYFGFRRPQRKRSKRPDDSHRLHTSAPGTVGSGSGAKGSLESKAFDDAASAWLARVAEHQRRSEDLAASLPAWENLPEYGPDPEPQARALAEPSDGETGTGSTPPAPAARAEGFQPFGTATTEPVPRADAFGDPTDRPATSLASTEGRPTVRRRTRATWLMALATAALAVGVLSSLGTAVPTLAYPAAVLLAVGLTLVAGSFFARPRGLIVVAVLLGAATLASALALPQNLSTLTVGERSYAYTHMSELPATVSVDAGEVTVDLTDLTVSRSGDLTVDVGTGEVNVMLPRSGAADVDWHVSLGSVNTPQGSTDGPRLSGSYAQETGSSSAGRVHVTIRVGLGEVTVTKP
jgi:phage shock protein PspC (stress-responsive transcriptional regulator)